MDKQLADFKGRVLSDRLEDNIKLFDEIFEKDDILRVRRVESGFLKCVLLFMDGMVDTATINESVVRPIIERGAEIGGEFTSERIAQRLLYANELNTETDMMEMLRGLLYGDTVMIIDGTREALVINTKGWRTRGISEPNDERALQGPREGFDEALMMNAAMIRRKLPTPDLCIELENVGRRTDTKVFICYLDSLVNHETVDMIKRRLRNIDIDGVLDSNYINELIKDNKFSLLKTTGTTERPDVVVARMLEGRVALLVDGTPVALTIPYLFCENFQADDDYYINFMVSSLGRALRYLCFFLAICVPALYVALISIHPELLPTSFAISVMAARGSIPFPSFVECILLILVFEILKETGVRMQQSVGHALSIVGGLVVGQAAVEAKIVSAPMLIVVALSGIAGLMVPRLKGAVFYVKLALVILSSLFGLFGFFVGITLFEIRVLSIRSFGYDYTESIRIFNFASMKDTFFRASWRDMISRPSALSRNHIRNNSKDVD